ncbi:uncharacterized protein At4g26485-like [Cucurbita moschata]|uniref:Uncharacterized protein At4g26485-like n=1 Tax=Cucurbita moschata TaxID=3662 RepID=A0A6J1H6C3_CUCMO|nr:uncharacterized protein At4g26485-like [Cucurbita moschata]
MAGFVDGITYCGSVSEKTIMHYKSSHTILLVGEGDFSFSACLAKAFGSAANMVATSLDSNEVLLRKYSRVAANLEALGLLGGTVLHEVDATAMSRHCSLCYKEFDRIIFNFPHAGFSFPESDAVQIKLHQDLVRGFLREARKLVSDKGEIHITHKISHPYCEWEIEKLAKKEGLLLKETAEFSRWDYPNYENKRGGGGNSDHAFPVGAVGACATFKFVRY